MNINGIIKILFYFIFIDISLCLTCTQISNPKSIADCMPYDELDRSLLCCYVIGLKEAGKSECYLMDTLFKDKTINFNVKGIDSTMNCGVDSVSTAMVINLSYTLVFIMLVIVLN